MLVKVCDGLWLNPSDVESVCHCGDTVYVYTRDGRKYPVSRNGLSAQDCVDVTGAALTMLRSDGGPYRCLAVTDKDTALYEIRFAVSTAKHRDDIIPLYARLIREHVSDTGDFWGQVNEAILERWAMSTLIRIKERAWKLVG